MGSSAGDGAPTGPTALRQKRRVLMLVENLSVPFDRRVWNEAVSLRDLGLDVVVVCPRGAKRDRESFAVIDGIAIHRFDLHTAGGALGYLREYISAFRSIRQLARRLHNERSFDVVHAASPPDFLLLATRSLRRSGTRFVFDHHDLSPELYETRYGRRGLAYRVLLRLERSAYRLADVVISANDSYRRIAIDRGRQEPSDVFVVRNGPDLRRFEPRDPDPSLRAGSQHLLCFVGMMGPQDGIEHALQALRALRARRDDWRAIFVGDGDVRTSMQQLAHTLGLDDVVDFTGLVSTAEVVRMLASADVCLSPEPSNPLNDVSTMIKVGEYMAMARPIVAFDIAETRAIAADAAIYAPPNDSEAFADAIDSLLDDPDRRRTLGEVGRRRAEEMLAWHHSAANLRRAYERILPEALDAAERAEDSTIASDRIHA